MTLSSDGSMILQELMGTPLQQTLPLEHHFSRWCAVSPPGKHKIVRCFVILQYNYSYSYIDQYMWWALHLENLMYCDATWMKRVHTLMELLAAFFAFKSFASQKENSSIFLRLDNVTAITFINRMGGTHSQDLSDLAVQIWRWCMEQLESYCSWKPYARKQWVSSTTH